MKNEWMSTFRSVTFAQRAERMLRSRQIPCQMQRTPKHLTERGCGYCLRLSPMDVPGAVELFRREKLPFEKLYAVGENGVTEERIL